MSYAQSITSSPLEKEQKKEKDSEKQHKDKDKQGLKKARTSSKDS
jgi:hypothetical protein